MSTPNFDSPNPYQTPASAGQSPSQLATANPALVKLVKDFRAQIHALGGFWIFIGLLVGAVSVFGAGAIFDEIEGEGRFVIFAIFLVLSLLWLTLGVLTCLKHIWAVYVGLVLSYLSLIGNVLSMSVCGIVILIAVIIQAHRVIGWASQLTRAGIPLTARPDQLHVEFRPPGGLA
jgi:hypothetical protein